MIFVIKLIQHLNRILIIQTASVGDVILATPIIEKLHHLYPEVKIDFLLKKGNEELLINHPFLNEIIVFDKKNGKIYHLLKIILKVRKNRYDIVINVQRFFSSGLITVFSGAKLCVGFKKNPLSIFFSKRLPHSIGKDNNTHEIDRNLSLLYFIDDKKRFYPCLYPPSVDFHKLGISEKYITISPASLWFTKQWPQNKWIELIRELKDGFQVVMLGSKNDTILCENIVTQCEGYNVLNLAGKLTFLESAAIMKNAVINFTNDSAPAHLASSVNASVCVVYCSTVPSFGFTPMSNHSIVVEVSEDLPCRPCGLHGHHSCPEKHFRCTDINVNFIIEKAGLMK